MTFKNLVLGNQKIETESQTRKLLLTAYLLLMYLGVQIYYFVVNLFNPEGEPITLFIGASVSIVCLFLLRFGWIELAIITHLIRSAFLPFYFSLIDSDPYQTATYLYFIAGSLGALAIFGYRERWKGISYTLVCFLLFVIAYFDQTKFRPDNPHFFFISNFAIVLILGGLIVIFFDRLSAQSEMKMIEKNKELEKLNAELDSFVYRASHDLRSPLSSILGLAEIASKTSELKEIKTYVEMIKQRVHVQDDFIKEIIDYSRNARTEVKPEKIELKQLINQLIEAMLYTEGAKSINFIIDIPSDFQVMADKIRLKVILSNLISNAIKYHDQSKSDLFIKISAEWFPTQIDISVEDNGIGIPQENHKKIFNMFYRGTEKSKGSGLGLYIAKEAVTKLGGTIHFKSTDNEGSCFTFSMPNN
jgi:signal transduction histidine kinase